MLLSREDAKLIKKVIEENKEWFEYIFGVVEKILWSQVGNNKESIWWRDLGKVWNLMELGNDFKDKGRQVVGDEKEIRLWEDKWVDNESLFQKFPRLFLVSLDVG